ncbi:MAG: substrate-binding domain-containing protein, partial [Anaerolineae bacterium]|nr:substrate-binding domain-containing protein [Anaerolineae bacterium]
MMMNHSYYQDYLLVNFKSGQCYNNLMLRRPTIGFISTWPIYQSTTIDRYAHSLIQGISSAATRLDCNLLLGCGSNISGQPANRRSFWPVPGPEVDFLPVGPWNTDGLIVVPDELTQSQIQYIHDLMVSGVPVIFTTPEGPGSLVKVDNQMGIRLAFTHLLEHGHRKIAYIAGHFGRGGDSEERLKAYYSALADAGLPIDERLVAFGEHRKEEGETAMQMIIASGAPFSAVIASNDLSCLGAIEFLSKVGKRIPQDVAVIGFDDILDARSLSPSLTTIRHPTFSLGFQAVQLLMEYIRGERKEVSNVVVPPQLIIRQSCGCRPGQWFEVHTDETTVAMLAHEMAEASLIDARNSLLEDLEEQLISMLNVLVESLKAEQPDKIFEEFTRILAWTEERGEDAHIWLTATSVLMQKINTLIKLVPNADSVQTASLLDRIRLEISDQIQRQTTRSMLGYMDMTAQLGQLTAEMLAAMNIDQSAEILARHLPRVGMKNALVAIYDDKGEEPTSHSTVLFGAGLPTGINGLRFESRKFPFPEIYPEDQAKQLTILPLDVDQKTSGFVAFTAQNPEMCAAIVLNLGASLRTSRLYQDAIEGRRLAEEANRLKSRFLSMVSHELRTPLSLIVGLSEMSLRENKIEVRDVEQINTSAQHLARLIGDVLDLASSEAGQLRILKEPLDLADVLNVPIKIGEQLVKEKGLTWQLNLTAHNLCILGDRTRLRQVTLNLLSNAVKFTEKGRIRMDVAQEGDHVCISISDTGMGIPNTELNTIFNEFYRSERSVESGVSGMGLGLAITRQLVEQHGGTIKVHSPGLMGTGS